MTPEAASMRPGQLRPGNEPDVRTDLYVMDRFNEAGAASPRKYDLYGAIILWD